MYWKSQKIGVYLTFSHDCIYKQYTGRKISTGVQLLNAKVMFITMTDLLPRNPKPSCVIFAVFSDTAHLEKRLDELQFIKAPLRGGE